MKNFRFDQKPYNSEVVHSITKYSLLPRKNLVAGVSNFTNGNIRNYSAGSVRSTARMQINQDLECKTTK